MSWTRLPGIIVALLSAALLLVPVSGARGVTFFFDDFNDADIADGTPASWQLFQEFEGAFSAASGDLVLSPEVDKAIAIGPVGLELGTTSIRAQLSMTETGNGVGVFARASRDVPIVSHIGGIAASGNLFIAREEPEPGSNPTTLAAAPTDLYPLTGDILVQMDFIGDTIQLWAWEPGQPMPAAPQVTATDIVPATGEVGVFFDPALTGNDAGTAVFRFFHVANTHIPEPSTFALAAILLGAIGLWRRRSGILPIRVTA
jgi:MYXO-CTERM domain-containing protein